jgi:hypothetical protein
MLLWMRSRLPVLVVMGALLVLAAVVAASPSAVPLGEGRPLFEFLKLPTITVTNPRPNLSEVTRERTWGGWTEWLGWFLLALPAAVLVSAIILAIVVGLQARRGRILAPGRTVAEGSVEGGTPVARLLAAAQAAQAEFDRHEGGPPADAVIAAWVRLEETAAAAGLPRLAHQTPTEFTDLLAGHATARDALDRLRGLYQRARFASRHEIGEPEAQAARDALAGIVRDLTPVPQR